MKQRKSAKKILAYFLSWALLITTVQLTQSKEAKATGHELNNPTVSNDETTWDCIYFGSYWQNDTNGDGVADQNDEKEPIKWRVLSVDGDDAFLLADQILDVKQYNDKDYEDENGNGSYEDDEFVTWENSKMRSWLNNEFLQDAFTEGERNSIISTSVDNEGSPTSDLLIPAGERTTDKIFLPSNSDMTNAQYGMSADPVGDTKRMSTYTDYAKQAHSQVNPYEDLENYFWLRAPSAYQVRKNGTIGVFLWAFRLPLDFYFGVRPVLHVNTSNNVWTKAETTSIGNGVVNTYTYSIYDEQWTLQLMQNKNCYIQIDNEPLYSVSDGVIQAGLSQDGLIWMLDENGELLWRNYGTNEGNSHLATEKDVECLIYNENNYVIGYKTLDGNEQSILSWEELKTKNPVDINMLRKLIKEQKALGATMEENVNDNETYEWSEAGRLTKIDWEGNNLSGSLNLQGLSALKQFNCADNELTNLDVSNNLALTSLNCENNKLNTLDVSRNTQLDYLNCNNNLLSDLNLASNTQLKVLYCRSNAISNLDLSKNNLLDELSCGGEKPCIVNVSNNPLLPGISVVGDVEVKGLYSQSKKDEIPNMAGLVPKYFFNFDFNLNGGYSVERDGYSADGIMPEKQADDANYYGEGMHGAALYLRSGGTKGVELPVSNLGNSYTISFWYKGSPSDYSSVLFAGTDILDKTKLKWLSITRIKWAGWVDGGTSPMIWSHSINGTKDEFPWYGYQDANGEWKGAAEDSAADALKQDKWTHIILTVDNSQTAEYGAKGAEGYVCSSKATTYINGRFFGTGVVVRDVFGKGAKTFLGINPWDASPGGWYDNLAFFDKAISAKQAQAIYEYESGEKIQVTEPPVSDNNPSGNITQKNPGNTVTQQKTSVKSETKISKPAKVNKVKASASKKKVSLNWKKVKGAKGYEIQYSTSKKWKGKKTKRTSKTKYTVKGLKKNKTYYFRVRAYKLYGKKKIYGKWSTVKKVKIKK